jgi:Protein of unknown function (DUF2510)
VSANPGWYPDPGGGHGLYRYWDGRAWSAATSLNPSAPPASQGLVGAGTTPQGSQAYGQSGQPYGQATGQSTHGQAAFGRSYGSAYANYQKLQKKKSPIGWWVAGAALVIVIVVVAVLAVRAVTGGGIGTSGGLAGQASQDVCPNTASPQSPVTHLADGRVHGGPVSYPLLGPPWGPPQGGDINPVPFGSDVQSQLVVDQPNYEWGYDWDASILVAELQAGDGFFTPEQGSQIVVKCILGAFYGDNLLNSNVKVNEKTTIDGHDAWLVESHLTFDIPGLKTKGELLIVAVVSAGNRSGLYCASIPDTTPELVEPARDALRDLQVDG